MEWNAREVLQSLRYIINTGKVRENCQFQEKQWVTHGIKLRSCMWSFYYLVYIRVFLLETRFFISVSSCYRENMISASKLLTGCSESLCWFFFFGNRTTCFASMTAGFCLSSFIHKKGEIVQTKFNDFKFKI